MLGRLPFEWLASCIYCVLIPQADPRGWCRGGNPEGPPTYHFEKKVQYEIKQECISVGCVPPARYRTETPPDRDPPSPWKETPPSPWTKTPLTELDQHQTCKPMMVSVVSSSPTGGKNVRFVLFTKTSNICHFTLFVCAECKLMFRSEEELDEHLEIHRFGKLENHKTEASEIVTMFSVV